LNNELRKTKLLVLFSSRCNQLSWLFEPPG